MAKALSELGVKASDRQIKARQPIVISDKRCHDTMCTARRKLMNHAEVLMA